jgi:hypothetical protein
MTVKENGCPQVEDKMSLTELVAEIRKMWKYLLSKYPTVSLVGLLGAALGFGYAALDTTEYVAKLSFSVVEKSSPTIGSLAASVGQFGLNIGATGGGVFSTGSIIELLQSRIMIEQTLLSKFEVDGQQRRLIDYYRETVPADDDDENRKTICFPDGCSRDGFSREQDSLLYVMNREIIDGKLFVDRRRKDIDIVQISFYSRDELFAKIFTERLIDIVSEFYILTKTKNIKINLQMMETRADSIRREYESALRNQAMYTDRNMNPSRQITRVEQQKIQTTIQLTGTVYSELVKNIEVMKMDLARQTPLIQTIDTPIMPLETKRTGKLIGTTVGALIGLFLCIGCFVSVYLFRRAVEDKS